MFLFVLLILNNAQKSFYSALAKNVRFFLDRNIILYFEYPQKETMTIC